MPLLAALSKVTALNRNGGGRFCFQRRVFVMEVIMQREMLTHMYIIVRVEEAGVYAIWSAYMTPDGQLTGMTLVDVRPIVEVETNGD